MKIELVINDSEWVRRCASVEQIRITYRAGPRRRLYVEEVVTDLDFEARRQPDERNR